MKRILIFALSLLIMVGSFSATSFVAAVDEATGKTNYAYGVTDIDFSGYYTSADGRIVNLTNGVYSNEEYCGSNDSATNHTVEIDLGESKYIDEVKLYHRSNGGKPSYTISVSTDGIDYTPVGTTGAYASYCTTLSFTETKARYVRATFIDNKDMTTQLVEFEVLGTPKTNIATGKTYTAYTTEGWYSDRTKVNDGDLSTEGSTKSTANTSYRLNLDDYYEIEEVTLYCRDNKAKNFTVKLGVDADKELDFVVGTTAVEADYSLTVGEHTLVKCSLDFSKGNVAKYVCIPITGQVYIREVVVYGKKVEAPTMGNITETADSEEGTTAVKLDVINGGATDITGNVYAAIYDDNDMLSAVYKTETPVTVSAGSYATIDDIALNAASGNLKLFLWDDKLIPLCAAK